MKAPALRVIKARIEAAVRIENQALQQEQAKENNKHQKALEQHRNKMQAMYKAAFAEDTAKYVTYQPGRYNEVGFTTTWTERVNAINEANPEPKQKRLAGIVLNIASLDLEISVADIHEVKWRKFAKECDEAFLEDDAKKIIEALEAIVG